jgi:hypothetical protein
MSQLEQLELQAHHEQLDADVRQLVDKYLAIAEWDVPEINEPLAVALIITAIRQALDRVEQALPAAAPT